MLAHTDISAEDLHIEQAKDALHILPLEMVTLATPGLRRMCLVKDAQLNTKVEVFSDSGGGRGLVPWNTLDNVFPAHKKELAEDMPTLKALSTLPSFDVFSLRIGLRQLGINVSDSSYLSLSPNTQKSLSSYMREFTKPLIIKIYGSNDHNITGFSDLVRMFKNPDKKEALKNLRQMSDALNVELTTIPSFLEDYGDMFLSVAYYRSNFDEAQSRLDNFVKWTEGITDNMYLARDKELMARCRIVQENVETIHYGLLNRLGIFQERFGTFWNDINARSFHEIKKLITANHEALGGALCGMSVKMSTWEQKFPSHEGAPNKRADFLVAEILPGLNKINTMVEDIRI